MPTGRQAVSALTDGDGDDEIFENLDGGVPADGGDNLSVLTEDDDDDLEVVEGDEEDGEGGEGTGTDEEEEEEEEEDDDAGATTAAAAVIEFDPKDVQLLSQRIETMELRETVANDAKARAEADLVSAEKAMETAKENGDTKGDVAATKAFAAATAALENAKTAINQIAGVKAGLTREAQQLMARAPKDPTTGQPILDRKVEAAPAREARVQKTPPAVKAWLADNKWYGDEKFSAQATTLQGLDQALAKEGKLKKGSKEYLTELGNRFNRVFPGIYKVDGRPVATGQRQRGNGRGAAGIPGGDGAAGAGRQPPRQQGGKVMLTRQDLKDMTKFGMDPESKEARRSWLTTKRQLAAKEGR